MHRLQRNGLPIVEAGHEVDLVASKHVLVTERLVIFETVNQAFKVTAFLALQKFFALLPELFINTLQLTLDMLIVDLEVIIRRLH